MKPIRKTGLLFTVFLASLPAMMGATFQKGCPPYDFDVGPFYARGGIPEMRIEYFPTFTGIADGFWHIFCNVYDYETKTTTEVVATIDRNYVAPIRMFAVFDFSDFLQLGRYLRLDFTFKTWMNTQSPVNFHMAYDTRTKKDIVLTEANNWARGKMNFAHYDQTVETMYYFRSVYEMPLLKDVVMVDKWGRIPLEVFTLNNENEFTGNRFLDYELEIPVQLALSGDPAHYFAGIGKTIGKNVQIPMKLTLSGDSYVLRPTVPWYFDPATQMMGQYGGKNTPSSAIATQDLYFPALREGEDPELTIRYVFQGAGRSSPDNLSATVKVVSEGPILGSCEDSEFCVGVKI